MCTLVVGGRAERRRISLSTTFMRLLRERSSSLARFQQIDPQRQRIKVKHHINVLSIKPQPVISDAVAKNHRRDRAQLALVQRHAHRRVDGQVQLRIQVRRNLFAPVLDRGNVCWRGVCDDAKRHVKKAPGIMETPNSVSLTLSLVRSHFACILMLFLTDYCYFRKRNLLLISARCQISWTILKTKQMT